MERCLGSLDRQRQSHGFGHCEERGEARIAARRQRRGRGFPARSPPPWPPWRCLPRFGNLPQGDQQHLWFFGVLDGRLEILGCEAWILTQSLDHHLIVRNALDFVGEADRRLLCRRRQQQGRTSRRSLRNRREVAAPVDSQSNKPVADRLAVAEVAAAKPRAILATILRFTTLLRLSGE